MTSEPRTPPRAGAAVRGADATSHRPGPADQTAGTPDTAARREYARRLSARREGLDRRTRDERRTADARLLVFASGLVLLAWALRSPTISWAWSLGPVAAYAALVAVHERLRRATRRADRAVDFYEKGLRRTDGTWPGHGVSGERFAASDHPYAADLDLFGAGSLFERLCTARTRAGEDALAAWLLAPADPATVRDRQAAVDELRPRLDLREDLELLGAEVRDGVDPEALAAWGGQPSEFRGGATAVASTALAALALAGLAAWALTDVGASPLALAVLAEAAFAYRQRGRVRRVLAGVSRRTHDLALLAGLLDRLEREAFRSTALTRLLAALRTEGTPASRRVAALARLAHLLDTNDNQLFAPLAALLLWKTHLAMAVDAWRARTGPEVAGWLAAVGEFEALCALASYAFENPADPFPEVVDDEALFDGEALGHPLIAEGSCVRNDLKLGGDLRVLLVSGSNMSGKSTILRTVGVNTVLALAGAPVRARRLRVTVFAVGATLRIQDSLQAGRSRFFAEITRVRQLVELSRGPRPLLFLLDEIFHGTNSHDRTVGAEAVVSGLIDRGAVGLVTTHDLALAAFADRLAPRAANVHFEDQLVGGAMRFDYRMQPGVVRHSNALALMRAVGLDV